VVASRCEAEAGAPCIESCGRPPPAGQFCVTQGQTGILLDWDGRQWHRVLQVSTQPAIDEPLGVWLDPTSYLARDGSYVPVWLPPSIIGWFTFVAHVPGTTTMVAVGGKAASHGLQRGIVIAFGPLR
jgi:hypothetical protein